MNKILLIFAILVTLTGVSAVAPSLVSAYSAPGFDICDGVAAQTKTCRDVNIHETAAANPVINNLKIALNILSFIAGIAAIVILIVNGLRLVLSNGDSNGVSSARSGLIYVVVGIVVVVFAQVIVIFVLDKI